MKVSIKNYQAIVNADLEFDVGLTAIVGSTNSGKSSIIRAIKGAVLNQGGNSFINYDADESSVSITDNNHTIEWIKSKKGGGRYVLDGNEITKIGVTQNEDVANMLNMNAIEVGKDKVNLNFWEQQEKAFLMDKTPGQLFEFISQSKEQEIINSYSEDNKKKVSDNNKTLSQLNNNVDIYNKQIADIETELVKLEPYKAIDELVIYQKYNRIVDLKQRVNDIVELNDKVVTAKLLLTNANNKVLPELDDTLIDKLSKMTSNVSLIKQQLNTIDNNKTNTENALKELDSLLVNQTAELNRLDGIIQKSHNLLIEYRNKKYSLDNLLHNKGLYDTILYDINEYNIGITNITTELNNLETELKTIDVCPLCETPLNNGQHSH